MHIHPVGQSPIGEKVQFASGEFAGRMFRGELKELQKADLGRKYARKDRRPLDPCPVVQFRLIEIIDTLSGFPTEVDQVIENYEDFKSFGFLCHVDLFPIPAEDSDECQADCVCAQASPYGLYPASFGASAATTSSYCSPFSQPQPSSSQMPYAMATAQSLSLPQDSAFLARYDLPPIYSLPPPPPPSSTVSMSEQFSGMPFGSSSDLYQHDFNDGMDMTAIQSESDVVAHAGRFEIKESSKCTRAIAGSAFVQASTVEHQGRRVLMFVYSDLAVKIEGTFILRYRVFNIFSKAHNTREIPILAECYGGPFCIYATRDFPGLRASTSLSRHIALFGVNINFRENERTRRSKEDILAAKAAADAADSSPTMSASHASSATSIRHKDKGKGKAKKSLRK